MNELVLKTIVPQSLSATLDEMKDFLDALRRYPLPMLSAGALFELGATPDTVRASQRQISSYLLSDDVRQRNKAPSVMKSGGPTVAVAAQPPEDWAKERVGSLKERCQRMGLLVSGTRAQLLERLRIAHERGASLAGPPPVARSECTEDVVVTAARSGDAADPVGLVVQKRISLSSYLEPQVLQSGTAEPAALDEEEKDCHDIVLLVDKRERAGGSHDEFVRLLRDETRTMTDAGASTEDNVVVSHTLPCGDVALAQRRRAQGRRVATTANSAAAPHVSLPSSLSYVGIVVERKTLSDLLSSIVSSRWVVQKEVLRHSMFPIRVILVEGSAQEFARLSNSEQLRVMSAMRTCAVVDRMFVIRTRSLAETVSLVSALRYTAQNNSCNLRSCSSASIAASSLFERRLVSTVDALLDDLRTELLDNSMPVRMLQAVDGVSASFAQQVLLSLLECGSLIEPRLHRGGGSGGGASSLMTLWELSLSVLPSGSDDTASGRNNNTHDAEASRRHGQLRHTLARIRTELLTTKLRQRAFAVLTHFLTSDVYT